MDVQLRNGVRMPLIGFGTFKIRDRQVIKDCVEAALQCGYRSIDTAAIYRNEENIGMALREMLPKLGIAREQLFLTSKLSPKDHGYRSCIDSVHRSLSLLQTSFIDLYLIHWPAASGKKPDDPVNSVLRQESWKALEHCYKNGLCKSIGVSNYCIKHLEEMKSYCETFPHVLQVEHHPHYMQDHLLQYCRENQVHYQAYSSLGTTVLMDENPLISDPVIRRMAEEYQRSPAQILLRWATQQGIGVLPKSTNLSHIWANRRLSFNISDDDMAQLCGLEMKFKYAWDPRVVV